MARMCVLTVAQDWDVRIHKIERVVNSQKSICKSLDMVGIHGEENYLFIFQCSIFGKIILCTL
jgi:hypothetical protein